jgi:hypothetical protein
VRQHSSRFRRFVVLLVLVAQLFVGLAAHAPMAHAAGAAACHQQAPSAHACACDSGACQCASLGLASLLPLEPIRLAVLKPTRAIAIDAPSPTHSRVAVLLRPPIDELPT